MHYGAASYYTLGGDYVRDRLRQPFIRGTVGRRLNLVALFPPSVEPPAPPNPRLYRPFKTRRSGSDYRATGRRPESEYRPGGMNVPITAPVP